ncbi:MAG: hypothetical protein ACI8VT_003885 [Saprospiraceae bacterium]|jgi:hypothetical protein
MNYTWVLVFRDNDHSVSRKKVLFLIKIYSDPQSLIL